MKEVEVFAVKQCELCIALNYWISMYSSCYSLCADYNIWRKNGIL